MLSYQRIKSISMGFVWKLKKTRYTHKLATWRGKNISGFRGTLFADKPFFPVFFQQTCIFFHAELIEEKWDNHQFFWSRWIDSSNACVCGTKIIEAQRRMVSRFPTTTRLFLRVRNSAPCLLDMYAYVCKRITVRYPTYIHIWVMSTRCGGLQYIHVHDRYIYI